MFGADHMNTVSVIGTQTRGWISTNKMIFRKFHLHVGVGEVPSAWFTPALGEEGRPVQPLNSGVMRSSASLPGAGPTDHRLLGPQPSTLAVKAVPPSSLVFSAIERISGLQLCSWYRFSTCSDHVEKSRALNTLPRLFHWRPGEAAVLGTTTPRPKCGKTFVFCAASHGVGSQFSQTLGEISASGCEAAWSPEPWPVQGSPGPWNGSCLTAIAASACPASCSFHGSWRCHCQCEKPRMGQGLTRKGTHSAPWRGLSPGPAGTTGEVTGVVGAPVSTAKQQVCVTLLSDGGHLITGSLH